MRLAHQAKAPEAKPDANEDLQSLPLPELQARLGSSPDALVKSRRRNGLPNMGLTRSKRRKPIHFSSSKLFLGPDPWMIEAAVILSALVRHWPDFFIILVLLLAMPGSVSGRNTRRG